MNVVTRITSFADRRSKAQLSSYAAIDQQRLDQAIEKRWRARVAAKQRARLTLKVMRIIDCERARA